MDFETRLQALLVAAQEVHDALLLGQRPRSPERIAIQRGPRYFRVVVEGDGPYVICFVDRRNGDVLKAKGWRGPDVKCKTRRNLADDDLHITALDMHRSLEPSGRARICRALGLPRGRSTTPLVGRTAWERLGSLLEDDDESDVASPLTRPLPVACASTVRRS